MNRRGLRTSSIVREAEGAPASISGTILAAKREFVNQVSDKIVPDIEAGAPSASLTIEDVLRPRRFIYSFYEKAIRSVIDGMGQRVERLPRKVLTGMVRDGHLEGIVERLCVGQHSLERRR